MLKKHLAPRLTRFGACLNPPCGRFAPSLAVAACLRMGIAGTRKGGGVHIQETHRAVGSYITLGLLGTWSGCLPVRRQQSMDCSVLERSAHHPNQQAVNGRAYNPAQKVLRNPHDPSPHFCVSLPELLVSLAVLRVSSHLVFDSIRLSRWELHPAMLGRERIYPGDLVLTGFAHGLASGFARGPHPIREITKSIIPHLRFLSRDAGEKTFFTFFALWG
jgi:hypothetical protein